MSYETIDASTKDATLSGRIQACVAQEQKAKNELVQPWAMMPQMTWAIVTAADVEAAYAEGGQEAVTDGMILANVQANWPTPEV